MGSGVSELMNERSAAQCESEAGSEEQANNWAVRANERADKQIAQYSVSIP